MLDTWYLRGRRVSSIKKCLTNFIYWSHNLNFFSYIIDLIWLSCQGGNKDDLALPGCIKIAETVMIMSLWFACAQWSCHFDFLLHDIHVAFICFFTKFFFIGLIPWNPPYVFIQCGVINKDPECALEYMMIMMIKRNYLKPGKPTPLVTEVASTPKFLLSISLNFI